MFKRESDIIAIALGVYCFIVIFSIKNFVEAIKNIYTTQLFDKAKCLVPVATPPSLFKKREPKFTVYYSDRSSSARSIGVCGVSPDAETTVDLDHQDSKYLIATYIIQSAIQHLHTSSSESAMKFSGCFLLYLLYPATFCSGALQNKFRYSSR